MDKTLGKRVLAQALAEAGTPHKLARKLRIPVAALVEYLDGRTPTPDAILLRAVDLLEDTKHRRRDFPFRSGA